MKSTRALYTARRDSRVSPVSTADLAEVLIQAAKHADASGVDPVAFLAASGLRIHPPEEAIARRVARLEISLADGFSAATAKSSALVFTRPTSSSSATSGERGSPSPTTDRARRQRGTGCCGPKRPKRGLPFRISS